ncbi:hypothetical protein CDAR_478581 [Caerostris darwini]|uniref:Uncharacterized protein n=1 Tax=Caerostris darwini TaxID=1538125 RepID=A0AAV4QM19_9ARAC|nr:hypothetical protein CDAR_478581 [Caerostris darwini]
MRRTLKQSPAETPACFSKPVYCDPSQFLILKLPQTSPISNPELFCPLLLPWPSLLSCLSFLISLPFLFPFSFLNFAAPWLFAPFPCGTFLLVYLLSRIPGCYKVGKLQPEMWNFVRMYMSCGNGTLEGQRETSSLQQLFPTVVVPVLPTNMGNHL